MQEMFDFRKLPSMYKSMRSEGECVLVYDLETSGVLHQAAQSSPSLPHPCTSLRHELQALVPTTYTK